MRIRRTTRAGFTIVEMMVATALILFLMAIIAQAFGAASKTFNAMRTAGNLQEKLRNTSGVIRKDLTSEHFTGPYVPGRSGPRLGDQRLDLAGWVPPGGGYVMIRQASTSVYEPVNAPVNDAEGLYSSRTDNTVFQFTVKLGDLPAAELFCADFDPTLASSNQINAFPIAGQSRLYSRWAEVQYFLRANGDSTPASAAGPSLPLYSLRRRVRLLAPKSFSAEVPAGTFVNLAAKYPDVAVSQGPSPNMGMEIIRVAGPEDVANPGNRLPYPPQVAQKLNTSTGAMFETGDDILQTDVISFEVKPAWFNNQAWNNNFPGTSPLARDIVNQGNSDYPFDDVPVNGLNTTLGANRVFDTYYRSNGFNDIDWGRASNQNNGFLSARTDQPPVRINVRSVQIKIRVYDPKSEQSRQVTIVQEM